MQSPPHQPSVYPTNQPTKTAPKKKKKENAAKLTHVEKRPPVQRRPRNLPPLRSLLQITPGADLVADGLRRELREVRAHDAGRELAREEQLHARRDRAVDQGLLRVVPGRAAGDAAYQRVLALQRGGEGGWGCEVGGEGADEGRGGNVGRSGAGEGGDVELGVGV